MLRHQLVVLVITIATACLERLSLHHQFPRDSFPQQDTGRLQRLGQAEQDISFHAMSDKMQPVCEHRDERSGSGNDRSDSAGGNTAIQPGTHVHYAEADQRERKV